MALLVLKSNQLFAQIEPPDEAHKVEQKNAVALFAGNTIIIPSGFNLPTLGVEYVREVNHYFGIEIISEIELGSHIVLKNENGDMISEVNREGAFLILPAVFINVYKDLIFNLGYGVEFEDKENLGLLKLGLEYKLNLHNPRWIVLPSVS
jgi:hypothetical protein